MTVSTIPEHDLIERLRSRTASLAAWVTIGIGDDAAVIRPERGMLTVLTTDSLVEDVHFVRAWTAPRAIGRKALAVNLSDLAAMGATPRAMLLSLALPADLPLSAFDALADGLLELAATARVPLVGGNITRSPGPLVVDVTLVGSARPRRIMRRSGGRAGDLLFVTGTIGGAAAGLAMRRAGVAPSACDDAARACLAAYESPMARLRTGIIVARNRVATACMDLSDGLADAVGQVAVASGVGAEVTASALPLAPGAVQWAAAQQQDAVRSALGGGEDYELLFAVPPRRRTRFLAAVRQSGEAPATEIGRLTSTPGAWLIRDGERTPLGGGFQHF